VTKSSPEVIELLINQFEINANRSPLLVPGPHSIKNLYLFHNYDQTIGEDLIIECIKKTPDIICCPIKRSKVSKDVVTHIGRHWKQMTDFVMQWELTRKFSWNILS